MDLPDWPSLRERMIAPKPALRVTAYAIGTDPLRVSTDDRGRLFRDDDVPEELTGLAWLASAIEPRLFAYLDRADGHVLARERTGGREAVVVEVAGLRREGGATFRLWVDDETGVVLRMERADDPAPLLVLDGLTVSRGEG